MGTKIALFNEKKYTFNGIFDIKETYNHIKEFLEDTRHYDISEKDYAEKNDGGKREIASKNEAEQNFSDSLKIVLKYELKMAGSDVDVDMGNGVKQKLTKGSATLIINCYMEKDPDAEKPSGPLSEFIHKVYDKYFHGSEVQKCEESASKDVGEMIARFKQQMNSRLS